MRTLTHTVRVLFLILWTGITSAQGQPDFETGSPVTLSPDVDVLLVYAEPFADADVLEATDFGETWYQIEYNDGDDRGWIPADFVEPFSNCPVN